LEALSPGFDPWAGGSHCWFAPGEIIKFTPVIQKNEGRIYFAGDHVAPIPGWVQSALMTAVTAVQEISAACCY